MLKTARRIATAWGRAGMLSLMFAGLSACSLWVGQDALGQSWVGQSLATLKSQWGTPQGETAQANGGVEVRYDVPKSGCTYWFTANAVGQIVSHRHQREAWGTCKPVG